MTREEIDSRIAQGEDRCTQFKRGAIGVAKLAAELTAFTDAEGDVVVVDIADNDMIGGLDSASIHADELSIPQTVRRERRFACTFGSSRKNIICSNESGCLKAEEGKS